jgi:TolB protein
VTAIRYVLATVLLLVATSSWAQLTIQITKGKDNPTPIAIVPFDGPGLPEDISEIIAANLQRSGLFAPIPKNNMLSFPHEGKDVFYRDWRALGAEYLVVGRTVPSQDGFVTQFELFDVINQRGMLLDREMGYRDNLREVAHRISDKVYEKITGVRGAFNTKMLYVSRLRDATNRYTYRLMLADADGAREQVLRTQRDPIMSPSWSPDAQSIAYTSFETGRAAIFMENLRTRERQQLTNFRGINSSPVWAPDGRRMAMVLSKDGNPEIYVMDVPTRQLTRLTNHFGIDTEPAWTTDGRSLLFTSDRGGRPQIYRANLATGATERVTFQGDYNTRARTLPDGSGFVMIHRDGGEFNVALQDTQRNRVQVLTQTRLDESPSVAPNGAMLIYATLHQGRGILAAVSVDAGVRYLLPSRFGDVREPAWSPFLDRR